MKRRKSKVRIRFFSFLKFSIDVLYQTHNPLEVIFIILNLDSIVSVGTTCLDIILLTEHQHNNWEFGPCVPSHTFITHEGDSFKYNEQCCVENDNMLLSCNDITGQGWENSYVKIGNHHFCDDVTEYKTMIMLNIPGMHKAYYVLLMLYDELSK